MLNGNNLEALDKVREGLDDKVVPMRFLPPIWGLVASAVGDGGLSGNAWNRVPVEAFIGNQVRHEFKNKRNGSSKGFGNGMHPAMLLKLGGSRATIKPVGHRNEEVVDVSELSAWWSRNPELQWLSGVMMLLASPAVSSLRATTTIKKADMHKVLDMLEGVLRRNAPAGDSLRGALSDLNRARVYASGEEPAPKPKSEPVAIQPRAASDLTVKEPKELLEAPAPELEDERAAAALVGASCEITLGFPVQEGVGVMVDDYNTALREAVVKSGEWAFAKALLEESVGKLRDAGVKFTGEPPAPEVTKGRKKYKRRTKDYMNGLRNDMVAWLERRQVDGIEFTTRTIKGEFGEDGATMVAIFRELVETDQRCTRSLNFKKLRPGGRK